MRIALCTDIYQPQLSGVADSIDILARELKKRGHVVRIYAPELPDAAPDGDIMRLRAYTILGSGGGLALVLPFGAMRDIREFKPDIIHTHTFSTVGFFALYAARRLGVPLVGTDHTFPVDYLHYAKLDFEPFRSLVRKLASWYYNRSVFVTAPSGTMLQELADFGLKRPMKAISNPIPGDVFRPLSERVALKEKFGITGNAILVFGRIAVEKSLDVALVAFATVSAKSDAELVFVGGGPYRKALEEKVRKQGLVERVRFLGTLRGEDLVEAINACDIFMITSTSETQSMTTLQSMACGLPVVAANAGGLPEYVAEGMTGYVVDPKRPDLFVERTLTLLADPDLRRRMGEMGRASAARFSPEVITSQFEEVYRKALEMKKN